MINDNMYEISLRSVFNETPALLPLLEELKDKQLWKPWYVCVYAISFSYEIQEKLIMTIL